MTLSAATAESKGPVDSFHSSLRGAIAQLVERFHGMEEVWGSNPHGSTNLRLQKMYDVFKDMPDPSYYRLFKILGHYCDQEGHGATDPVWHEIAEKLRQLDYIEEKILQLNTQCGEWNMRRRYPLPEVPLNYEEEKEASKQLLELQIYTEAFYNSAWILQELLKVIPGLNGLDLKAIRLIRGDLMVHPRGRHIASFAYGGPEGPMIKPDIGQAFNDPGFFANTSAMKRKLFDIRKKLDPKRDREALDGPELQIGFF